MMRLGLLTFWLLLAAAEPCFAADAQPINGAPTTLVDRLIAVTLDSLFRNAQPVNKGDGPVLAGEAGPVLIDSHGCLWGLQEKETGVIAERIMDRSGKQAYRSNLSHN